MAVKRVLVTGVSRGIGLEVARMLLADGWLVAGLSRTRPPRDLDIPWIKADVATLNHRVLEASTPTIDALVHCAAIQGPIATLTECDPADWWHTAQVNLLGTYNVVRAVLPALQQSDDARILLFSGGGAFNPRPDHTAYAASKAGVVSLMETLADELRHTTVTVNVICPGYVPTSIHGPDVKPDNGEAMAEAVACVRHMLSPATHGLTGKSVSAPHDAWRDINPMTVASVNASVQGTRTRHPIQRVAELARVPAGALV